MRVGGCTGVSVAEQRAGGDNGTDERERHHDADQNAGRKQTAEHGAGNRIRCWRPRPRSGSDAAIRVSAPTGRTLVRFFSFHLMPYIGLDPAYDGPAWVTCPNS